MEAILPEMKRSKNKFIDKCSETWAIYCIAGKMNDHKMKNIFVYFTYHLNYSCFTNGGGKTE